MISARLVSACVALVLAHWSGIRTDRSPDRWGRGGPAGTAAFLLFLAATFCMWFAVR